MSNDLEQRVHALIYDADPEIPAAAVIALVRAAVADEIASQRQPPTDNLSYREGYLDALGDAEVIADPSRTASLPEGN